VSVRALSMSDYDSIKNWEDDENNFNYFPNTNFLYDIKNPSWIKSKIEDDKGLYLSIIDNQNDNIVGLTLLENIDINNRNACWGIYISGEKYRKLNYTLESAFFIIDYAFFKLKLNKIYNNTLATNLRGRKFHKKLGFKEEAVFNNQILVDGYYADLIWSSISHGEWQNIRSHIENTLKS
tara:strand:+ start:242 stop:781 length:540 start_codon:yes stop_codon:yes gene_type:complete